MATCTTVTATIATRPCMFCRQASEVELTPERAAAIGAFTPIQDVLPDVAPAMRELLISGTHPSCWEEVFG